MTGDARKLHDIMERARADYAVLKRQEAKQFQVTLRLHDEVDRLTLELDRAEEKALQAQGRVLSATERALGLRELTTAQKRARKDAVKRARMRLRAAEKAVKESIAREQKLFERAFDEEEKALEAKLELEDLGYRVNPMKKTHKKTRTAPSAKQLAARRKFAAMARARAKAARAKRATKAKPRKKNKTVIKAKRVTILNLRGLKRKANPPRRPNITSASDLAYAGTAKSTTRDGVKGWEIGGKFFPRTKEAKSAKLTSNAYLYLKTGDVWVRKAKNPKRKNISEGFYDANGVFHPIRSASDYDPGAAGETGGRPRRTKSGKRRASAKKASATARWRAATKAKRKTVSRLAGRSLSRVPKGSYKKTRRKNVEQGFYDGNGVFHPIRASADYDAGAAGEMGGKARHTRSKKRAASKRKASATARHRAATKARKATTTRLAGRSLQRVPKGAYKKRRGNPTYRKGQRVELRTGERGVIVSRQPHGWNKEFGGHTYSVRLDSGKVVSAYTFGLRALKEVPAGKRRRGNPDATAQRLEEFRGYPKRKDTPLQFSNGTPANLYRLGVLKKVILQDGTKIDFPGESVWLCADEHDKMHIGHKVSNPSKRLVAASRTFGRIRQVEYLERKPHLGHHARTLYFHKLGEEDGRKPTLSSDKDGNLVIRGGNYRITREGIAN